MIVGDNGIITQAQRAKEETERAGISEKMELLKLELEIDTSGTLKSKMIENGMIDEEEINEKGIAKINNKENYIAISAYQGLKELCASIERRR